ncbi:MAG: (d)CMP kinase [Clostridia bacterium]|nr:(d)CMP kinase [Clostridia bacterium]
MANTIKVAIDGPSGAGKSSIAKAASKVLGFVYVDTGALYRTVALNALRKGADPKNAEQVIATLENLKVTLGFVEGTQHVYLNGEDVSDKIRTPEISMGASAASAIPEVRKFLFNLQREIADANNCIMDGRDIGTVVLPDAKVKIFLTASPEIRAERRYKELCEKGTETTFEEVLADVKQRDYNDSHREIAPLKATEESVIVDTTELDLEQSIQAVIAVIEEKMH